MHKYADCDFCGWATVANVKCSDGRTILPDAFKHQDGNKVPLVWGHVHDDPEKTLGHAFLENRPEGVYAYGYFNDTPSGVLAKKLTQHGDLDALSIWANGLSQDSKRCVSHGDIKELSLVLAGANPKAKIETVIRHGVEFTEEAYILGGNVELMHADIDEDPEDESAEIEELVDGEGNEIQHEDAQEEVIEHEEGSSDGRTVKDVIDSLNEKQRTVFFAILKEAASGNSESVEHSDEASDPEEVVEHAEGEETVADILNTFNEEQMKVLSALCGKAIIENKENIEHSEGGNDMKKNAFNGTENKETNIFSLEAQKDVIQHAIDNNVGFQRALKDYCAENELAHDVFSGEDMGSLLPDYQLIDPKAPPILYPDDSWVDSVINGVHKSPVARIRTRKADARQAELKALGYKKGTYKKEMGKINLLGRTHDAQTIYIKDKLNRDDILDITDFDVVNYEYAVMRHTLNQEIAQAIMFGDGRDVSDPDKIKEDHIRPIWKDDELYCMHYDVDFAAMGAELTGSNNSANFGKNYIWAEAIIAKALYAREQYKGSGNLTFYCTPHTLNVMLLARDLNGRRIYSSKADLVAALDVKAIQTIEQIDNLVRTDDKGNQHKLLGIFVNLQDYTLGCVKGGQITKFEQFDIDFNQLKMLLETRLSGALVEWYSAIALEEAVEAEDDND